jgi:transcriptional regulator with XRE-family HTH domain
MTDKPSDYDLFNDDSLWGNQTAGGLSNDDILNKNWNMITANRQKLKDPTWIEAQRKGYLEYLNGPDYVNSRGMLGKKRTKESIEQARQKLLGQVKPLEGNDKLRKYRKGKKVSVDVLEKVSAALTGRESGRSRKVQTPIGEFTKLKLAAEAYGVSPETIKQWMKKKPNEFYFVDPIDVLGSKKISTPDGIFDSATKAAEYYSISNAAIRHRIKNWDNWNYLDETSKFRSPQIKD